MNVCQATNSRQLFVLPIVVNIFRCFFTCIFIRARVFICENGECEIDISNRINEENCLPRRIHITHIFRTYLLDYISFIGLFCLHTPQRKGGLVQKWVHSNELRFRWLEPYSVLGNKFHYISANCTVKQFPCCRLWWAIV